MLLLIFMSVLCLLPFLYWYYVQFKFRSLNKIPGPDPIPVIGNLISSDPHESLRILQNYKREYGSLFKLWAGPFLRVVMTNPDDIETVLTSNVHITKSFAYNLVKPWIGMGLLLLTDAKWKYHRKIITPTFHFTILEEFMRVFNKSTDNLIEKLKPKVGKEINAYDYATLHTLDMICETSMGTKVNALSNESGEYVKSITTLLNIIGERVFTIWMNFEFLYTTFAKNRKVYKKCLDIAHNFCEKVIQNRRSSYLNEEKETNNEEEEDFGIKRRIALIDTLLKTENTLTDEDIRDEITTFIFEGQDTTGTGISFCIYSLAQNQEVQQTLYEEIVSFLGTENRDLAISEINELPYLDMVIKEAQRICPSVPFIERELQSDFEIGGIKYPKGTTLSINIYLLHHDPEIYPNPEKFDPDRFSAENHSKRHRFAYIPFSAGPRNCIGQRFAILEMKTTIIKLLQNYKLSAVPGHKLKLGLNGILKALNDLPVRLEKRM